MSRTPITKHITRYRCTTAARGHIYDVISPAGAILGDGFPYLEACQRAQALTLQMSGLFDDDLPGGAQDLEVAEIGTLPHPDGRDQYVLVRNREGDLTPDQACAWLLPRVYRNSDTPGGYYCTRVLATQAAHSDNTVICTIHHRYDI